MAGRLQSLGNKDLEIPVEGAADVESRRSIAENRSQPKFKMMVETLVRAKLVSTVETAKTAETLVGEKIVSLVETA